MATYLCWNGPIGFACHVLTFVNDNKIGLREMFATPQSRYGRHLRGSQRVSVFEALPDP